MKKIFLSLLLTFIFLGSAIAGPASSSPSIEELMHKSGLWIQIAQIEQLVQVSVTQEQTKIGNMDENDAGTLRRAIATAYSADRLSLTLSIQAA